MINNLILYTLATIIGGVNEYLGTPQATTPQEQSQYSARTQFNLTRAPLSYVSIISSRTVVAKFSHAGNTGIRCTAGRCASPALFSGEAVTIVRITESARAGRTQEETDLTETGLKRSERPVSIRPGSEVCMSGQRPAAKGSLRFSGRWSGSSKIPGRWWHVQKERR